MEPDEFDVVAAGSVFKGDDPVFLQSIEEAIHVVAPAARLQMPLYAPVVGAALLAAEAMGTSVDDRMYGKLEGTLPESLRIR